MYELAARSARRALVLLAGLATGAGLVLVATFLPGAPTALAAPGDLVYSEDWELFGTVDDSGNWIYWDGGHRPTHVDEDFPVVEIVGGGG
jgi:hypothetical protein